MKVRVISLICHFFQGRQSFASYESLEQLHRLLFVLGITHVLYSFYAVALTMLQVNIGFKLPSHGT